MKTAEEIIKEAINDPEFIRSMCEAFDFFDTIAKAYNTDNVIILNALIHALERRVIQLNIQHWFERVERALEAIEYECRCL